MGLIHLEILNTTHDNNFFTRDNKNITLDILFFKHGFAKRKRKVVLVGRKACKKKGQTL